MADGSKPFIVDHENIENPSGGETGDEAYNDIVTKSPYEFESTKIPKEPSSILPKDQFKPSSILPKDQFKPSSILPFGNARTVKPK